MKKMPVKKKVGVKKLENRPKSGREIVFFAREKIEKMAKNGFHGEKKNTALTYLYTTSKAAATC